MHLTYGGYSHAENEVWLNIQRRMEFSPRGRPMKVHNLWTIRGVLIATSEAELTSSMLALENAYSYNGSDLLFYGNSSTVTAHSLLSSGAVNGVQVQRFAWLPGNGNIWGSGTEYTNKRSYEIVVKAEYLNETDNVVYYQSTVSGTGNTGPRKSWQVSLTGYPQQQLVQTHTTQKIVQSGYAVGLTTYPVPDTPLYPGSPENSDMRNLTYGSPQHVGINRSTHFPVRWRYFFETHIPLVTV